jgi:hypothetical protein
LIAHAAFTEDAVEAMNPQPFSNQPTEARGAAGF